MKANERRQMSTFQKIFKTIISIIVIAFQLFFYYMVFFGINKYPIIVAVVEVIAVISVYYIYNSHQNASYKLSWVIFILVVPVFGEMCYLFFGNGRSLPKRKVKELYSKVGTQVITKHEILALKDKDIEVYKNMELLSKLSNMQCHKNTECKFFNDAKLKHQALIDDLKSAEKYIFLEYFIISEGKLLEELKTIITEKSKQGVEVKIIYDDIGSAPSLKKKTVKYFDALPNVDMVAYNPMNANISLAINFRDHRKIAIIDGKVAYVGGDNLADEYIHEKIKYGLWRDNAVRLSGDAVKNFIQMFIHMYYMTTKVLLNQANYEVKTDIVNDSLHCPFGDGPVNPLHPAYNLIESLASNAQKYLYISTPYLIIDKEFINRIASAAISGIDVRILVPKIPDKKMVFKMTRAHYGDLLKVGVKIYEYTAGFNHAKNIIVDDKMAIIGTINIDYRSLL
ncbi:MAG: phospholipase D-like domain-containing protein, partial [Clostridia bacterium]